MNSHYVRLPTWLVALEVTVICQILLVWSENQNAPALPAATATNSAQPATANVNPTNVSLSSRRFGGHDFSDDEFVHYRDIGLAEANPHQSNIPTQFGNPPLIGNRPNGPKWQPQPGGRPGAPGRPGGMGGMGVPGAPGLPGGMQGTLIRMTPGQLGGLGNLGPGFPPKTVVVPPSREGGFLAPGNASPGKTTPGGTPSGKAPPGVKPPEGGGKPPSETKPGEMSDEGEQLPNKPIGDDKMYEYEGLPDAPELINMDVECSLTSMRVRVTFDRPYEGGIYASLYYDHPDCLFVPWGGMETEYEFELNIDQCGTTFFATKLGGSDSANNLENTLIFQNDPDIQGKWDEARRLQCSWAERMNHSVSHGFQMDVLDTVTVKFSGDNVNADMDIEVGRGPFAPRAEGLIKIGELLTLVIYVYGGSEMDIDIRQCIAHNGDRGNSLVLSDDRGCIVKKNLMGAWQFTHDTGATGATIIAFAYMQAFRFPDTTDVYVECNLEICKGACPDHCPEYPPLDLRFTGKRKRRHAFGPNVTQEATLLRSFRVMADSDVTMIAAQRASHPKPHLVRDKICMTVNEFAAGLTSLVVLLLVSSAAGFVFCRRVKPQHIYSFGPKSGEIAHIKMPGTKQTLSAASSLNDEYDEKHAY